ncbi:Uncharacterised protein [Vibrio cholerae]|nr:Uncharacterised protein [Vibrio cholerae]
MFYSLLATFCVYNAPFFVIRDDSDGNDRVQSA